MSGFYSRNIFVVIFLTIISIDWVAIQTDFLNSLHLIGNKSQSIFMGWLGTVVLITICIYPLVYCFLAWLRLIPARWAGFLEAIPFMGFGIWLAFIAYLAALTEFGTVSVRLRPGLSEDKIMSICNEAQAEGIPMTIAFEPKNGDVAWINAKYAREGEELCAGYVEEK